MKYIDDENMEEILLIFRDHTNFNVLSHKYGWSNFQKFKDINEKAIQTTYSWLCWRYKEITNQQFLKQLIMLEQYMLEK
jgi:hypothetical protein